MLKLERGEPLVCKKCGGRLSFYDKPDGSYLYRCSTCHELHWQIAEEKQPD
jgi:hypothetical protein